MSYFQQLGEYLKRQRLDKTDTIYHRKKDIAKSSYELPFQVAKNMKAHSIGESLIMPAAKTLVKHVIEEEAAAKPQSVSLSNIVKN